jgi:hypothetical protein
MDDLLLVFETYLDLWEHALIARVPNSAKKRAEQRAIAQLRVKIRAGFARFDGGLIYLSNADQKQ